MTTDVALGTGPSCFRTEVTRRTAERGARRDVTEALAWDHDRLDALEQRTFELFAIGDARGAQATWSEFTVGLRRHIRFEEEILFPTFEGKLGIPLAGGPTGVMRAEHREIERLIEAIGRAFAGDGAALPLRSDLHGVLGDHNMKEEHVLYPGTNQCLDSEERDALVARIQAS
jgi:hemerythrin-like domain-containing protein